MRETNLQYILRDPVPYLNRRCERYDAVAPLHEWAESGLSKPTR
jgi:hypothetical protein